MNTMIFIAGCLCILMGAVHSILGEILIFENWRNGKIISAIRTPEMKERHSRIIWASWHVLSFFGWAVGIVLIWISKQSTLGSNYVFVVEIITYLMLISSILVLYSTKGKHPGWVGFLAITILLWLS